MTWEQFEMQSMGAAALRSRRSLSQEDVDRAERVRDSESGQYVPHHHHPSYENARH